MMMMMIVGLFNDATSYYGLAASERLYRKRVLKNMMMIVGLFNTRVHNHSKDFTYCQNEHKQNMAQKTTKNGK